jgi:hypothetical protein
MRFEMTLTEEEHRDLDQGPSESSNLEGVVAVAEDVFDPGGGSKSTSLAKMEC